MGGADAAKLLGDVGPEHGHVQSVPCAAVVGQLSRLSDKYDVVVVNTLDNSTLNFMNQDAAHEIFCEANERHVVVHLHEAESAGHPEDKVHGSAVASAADRRISLQGQGRVHKAAEATPCEFRPTRTGGTVEYRHHWSGPCENDNVYVGYMPEVQDAIGRAAAKAGAAAGAAAAAAAAAAAGSGEQPPLKKRRQSLSGHPADTLPPNHAPQTPAAATTGSGEAGARCGEAGAGAQPADTLPLDPMQTPAVAAAAAAATTGCGEAGAGPQPADTLPLDPMQTPAAAAAAGSGEAGAGPKPAHTLPPTPAPETPAAAATAAGSEPRRKLRVKRQEEAALPAAGPRAAAGKAAAGKAAAAGIGNTQQPRKPAAAAGKAAAGGVGKKQQPRKPAAAGKKQQSRKRTRYALPPEFVAQMEAVFERAKAGDGVVYVSWDNDLDHSFVQNMYGVAIDCKLNTNKTDEPMLRRVLVLEPVMEELGLERLGGHAFKAGTVTDYLVGEEKKPLVPAAGYKDFIERLKPLDDLQPGSFSLVTLMTLLPPGGTFLQYRAVLSSYVDFLAMVPERRPPHLQNWRLDQQERQLLCDYGLVGAVVAEQVMRKAAAAPQLLERIDKQELHLDPFGDGLLYESGLFKSVLELPPKVAAFWNVGTSDPHRFRARYAWYLLDSQPQPMRFSVLVDVLNAPRTVIKSRELGGQSVAYSDQEMVEELWQSHLVSGQQLHYMRLTAKNSKGTWSPMGFVASTQQALVELAASVQQQLMQEIEAVAALVAKPIKAHLLQVAPLDHLNPPQLQAALGRYLASQLRLGLRGVLFSALDTPDEMRRTAFVEGLAKDGVVGFEALYTPTTNSWSLCHWAATSSSAATRVQQQQQQLCTEYVQLTQQTYPGISSALQTAVSECARPLSAGRYGLLGCFDSLLIARGATTTTSINPAAAVQHIESMLEQGLLPGSFVLFPGPRGIMYLARSQEQADDALQHLGGSAQLPESQALAAAAAGEGPSVSRRTRSAARHATSSVVPTVEPPAAAKKILSSDQQVAEAVVEQLQAAGGVMAQSAALAAVAKVSNLNPGTWYSSNMLTALPGGQQIVREQLRSGATSRNKKQYVLGLPGMSSAEVLDGWERLLQRPHLPATREM